MFNNWRNVIFSEVIKINPRETLKKGSIHKKVGMADIQEHTKNIQNFSLEEYKSGTKFRQGDTLFARITPCLENGKVAKVDILADGEIGFGSTEFIVMRAIPKITDDEFIYYLSLWDKIRGPAIKSMTGTSGRQRVQNTIFDQLSLKLPPISEQEVIGRLLSLLDDKIENNNAIISNLEAQAQAIFKSWFLDFAPFQVGKIFDSKLGRIPEGWEVKSLYDIANFKNGLAMQKYRPEAKDDSLPVLKIKELRANRTDFNSERCMKNIQKDVLVEDGDVIFSWSGSLLLKLWTGGEAGLNQHLFKVTSKKFNKWFYYYWIDFFLEQFQAIARDRATTMGHIKIAHLKVSVKRSNQN